MKKRIHYLFMVVGVSLLAFACSDNSDDDQLMETSQTIVEVAQDTDVLTSLVGALAKADEADDSDLIGTLSGNGPFTVFAPTNEAFTNLLNALDDYGSLEDFDTDEDRMILASILKYHVIAGVGAKSTDLSDGQQLSTVLQENLSVRLDNGVFISDATETDAAVVVADVMASNGVVHLIDKVLVPQVVLDQINDSETVTSTLTDLVVETEALSVLEAAVIKADLAETLSSDGPFTVFAPTNDAFIALLDALGEDYNSLDDFDTEDEMALLKDILLYHVIVGASVLSTDLAEGDVDTALANNSIAVIASGETFVIGDASDVNANITGVDIMASNGVAHTIDKVLLPQSAIDFIASMNAKNIVELAIDTEDLSALVAALQQADAGLVELLSGEGPFTVFAPTNQAFENLLHELGDDYNSLEDFDTEEEKATLANILTYHVVSGAAVYSNALSDGQVVTMAQENETTILINGSDIDVQDGQHNTSRVLVADQEARNGVVHIVDRVLLPPSH
ncbi:fasciclin domain-containing protein [Maribacter algicola]|uniref:Fasciclin domain-containing protein n=1 Tax=Meishania litoralis TaxID=3434685 RepID=A0ACC7LI59_9FLAO